MVDLKRAGEHLQSARMWISHAQDAFDKQKDIRGELNLFLAQAELKRVSEANRSGKRRKYSLLRQLAAFCLAVMMFTAGIGGAYWLMNREAPDTSQVAVYHSIPDNQEAKNEPQVVEKPVQSSEVQSQYKSSPRADAQPQAYQTVSDEGHGTAIAAHAEKNKEKVLQDNAVSPDEMQKLVRVAGKSLRGQ